MTFTVGWAGDGAPRLEIAHVELDAHALTASGTQLGSVYELRYLLEAERLSLELVGRRSVVVDLEDADFFDLGWSPLFNSLPVIRNGLLDSGVARTYSMRWVDVPSLEVSTSEQRYQPLGSDLVRYTAGRFTADIRFDEQGLVVDYPGLARRLNASA